MPLRKALLGGIDKAIRLIDTGDEKTVLMVSDLGGILALMQANVLEIHVWGSRAESLEKPDRLIFDLDPGEGVSFGGIKAAAIELRERLTKFGLVSFLKTSGARACM